MVVRKTNLFSNIHLSSDNEPLPGVSENKETWPWKIKEIGKSRRIKMEKRKIILGTREEKLCF